MGEHAEDDVKICIADVEPETAPEEVNEAPEPFDAKAAWAKLSIDKRLALMRKAQLRQQGSGDFRTIATLGRDSRDDPASPSASRSDNSHYAANYELSVEMPAYARGRSVEAAPEGEVSANTARLGMRPPPTAQERV